MTESTDHFRNWHPHKTSISVETQDAKRYCQFNSQSPPIVFPSSEANTTPVTLPLFGSAGATGTLPQTNTDTATAASTLPNTTSHDVLLHTGGPVWALDWCPSTLTTTTTTDDNNNHTVEVHYLAVGCHPLYSQTNKIGVPVSGPNSIQIWQVPAPDLSSDNPREDSPAPSLAFVIAHDGGPVWKCCWCPDPSLSETNNNNGGNGGGNTTTTNNTTRGARRGGSSRGGGSGNTSSTTEGLLPRLGLLAAALADGSVRIWSVPQPFELKQTFQQQQEGNDATAAPPLVVHLPPVAVINSAHISGALPSVLHWLPSPPHDLLLVGCWDGSAIVAKLTPNNSNTDSSSPSSGASPSQQQQQQEDNGGMMDIDNNDDDEANRNQNTTGGGGAQQKHNSNRPLGCEILAHFPADVIPLRAVQWLPATVGSGDTLDNLNRSIFLTAGHEGTIKIWDVRDQFEPLYFQNLSTGVILDATWTSNPYGIITAMEDGSLRGILLGSQDILANKGAKGATKPVHSIGWRGSNVGALWSVACHPTSCHVAYSGEDGIIACFPAEYWWDNRKRKPHDALGSFKMADGTLSVMSASDLDGNAGLYADRTYDRNTALLASEGYVPDEMQAVTRMAWSSGGGRWLASGGGGGIVRCQWVAGG